MIDASPSIRRLCLGLNNRGLVHYEMGKWPAALADFEKASTLNPTSNLLRLRKSIVLMEMDSLEESLAELDILLAADSTYLQGYGQRGKVKHRLGLYDRAIHDFSQALDLSPDSRDLYFARAKAYREVGETQAMMADLRRAQQLGYQLPAEYLALLDHR